MDPGPTAIGTWSGGRFMSFGEPLEDGRLLALLRPGAGIDTVITADAYGAGEADRALGEALAGIDRQDYCLVGAIGHDFYEGAREGAKGYPRFTDPRLRQESAYAGYIRMATERSLERCGAERFDLLLLHNPDRRGYRSAAVWEGLEGVREAGLTRMLGVAPGPANGFTLDLIACFERFSAHIDWAMIILNPLEPWPGELALAAARAHEVELITRVVDYGGLFHDDVLPGHEFGARDHRAFRPAGWVEDGRAKLERMRPIAERHQLTMLQLACAWNLAHEPVRCAAPTLIQERGAGARAVEDKRAELAAFARALSAGSSALPFAPDGAETAGPASRILAAEEVRAIRAIGDNKGCMALKGASPEHAGDEAPDRWQLDRQLAEVAARWEIEPERDLARVELSGAH
jgi:aryl-alcohol dehydrogenase-like predicted oxidoreductase